MSGDFSGIGRSDFVNRHGIPRDPSACESVIQEIESRGLETVRLSFADQHGVLRGKTLVADAVPSAMTNGCTMTTTLLAKDTSHKTQYPVFTADGGFGMREMSGAGDIVMVPDPATFRVLPWLEKTGWMLCDIYFTNGKPVPFSTRRVLQDALSDLGDAGFDFVAGLEVEFHVFKIEDPNLTPADSGQPSTPPDVSVVSHGFQYLTELRADEHEPIWAFLRKDIQDLDLPLRTMEVEFGPSQFEASFDIAAGITAADNMMLFRSAVKQICRRQGYHATFMCRPGLPNIFSSGWHLHQSLRARDTGENAFVSGSESEILPELAMQYAAGILEHARAASVFTTPTINGYKRYQPMSLAPDRIAWGDDNKGAMLRVVGGYGDPLTHLENRVGEPAANPYLYLASQILSGMEGVGTSRVPPPMTEAAYEGEAPNLPASLMEAVVSLDESDFFRDRLGDRFVDYIVHLKRAEIGRFLSEVTNWEHREYFEIF